MASPFYPGYYPGERIIRRPSGGERFPKGPLYEFTDPNDILAAIEQDLDNASDLLAAPKWIRDRMVGDLKRTLTVEATPKGYAATDTDLAEIYGDVEELPGAFGTSINFNPVDWVKDPAKEFKKFPNNIKKNLTSFADVDLRNEREFWSRVVNGRSPLGLGQQAEISYKRAAGVAIGRELTDLDLSRYDVKKYLSSKAFHLQRGYVPVEVNVYDDVRIKFLDFVNASKGVGSRPGKYRSFQNSVVGATRAELDKLKLSARFSRLTRAEGLSVESFIVNTDVAESMQKVADSLKGLNKGLSSAILEGGKRSQLKLGEKFNNVVNSADSSRKGMEKLRGLYKGYGIDVPDGLEKQFRKYESLLGKIDEGIGTSGPVGLSDLAGRISKKDYASIGRLVDTDLKKAHGMTGGFQQLLTKGNLFDNRGDIYKGGIQDNYLTYLIGNGLFGDKDLAGVIDSVGLEGVKRMRRIANVAQRKRDWEHGGDFIKALEGGKLLTIQLWVSRLQDRIQAWTPAFYVKEFLFNRTHSFGAKYSASKNVYGFWDRMVKSKKLAFIFENRFKLKLSHGTVGVVGGKQFSVALDLFNQLRSGRLGDVNLVGLDKVISFSGSDAAENAKDFIRFVNTKFEEIFDKSKAGFILKGKDAVGVEKYVREIKGLKKWLLKNKDELGLTFDNGNLMETGENFKRLEEVFRKLSIRQSNPASLDITHKFVGWLEKTSSKLSFLQSEVFKRASKVLAPITYIKIAVSEAVADVFAGTATAATAGVAAAIAPIIRLVTRYVVKKVLDAGQAVLNAFAKADFNKLMDEMEESAQKTIKWIVAGCGCAFLPIALGILFITTVITAVISPYDPTKKPPMQLDQVSAFWDPAYDQYLGITGTQSTIECFKFVNADGTMNGRRLTAWDPGEISSVFEPAINRLQLGGDGYMNRLCSDGDIELYRTYDSPGYCGHVFGDDKILFLKPQGHYCYNNADYTAYFFAHETGHIYDGRSGGSPDWDIFWSSVEVERTLPSYPGVCRATNSSVEDFAETIGDYIWKNTRDCGDWSWGSYPNHFEFVQNVLFR